MASVKLTHPDSKATIEVAEDQADIYLSQGWVEKTPSK